MKVQAQTDARPRQTGVKIFFLFSLFLATELFYQHKHMTSEQEETTLGVLHRDAFGQPVMFRNTMDGFQTKSKFEERVAARVGADDG